MSSSFAVGSRTVSPLVVSSYEAAREVRNVFNAVLGAQATVAVAFPAGLRAGTLVAVFTAQADALTLDSMLAGTAVITYADSDVPAVGMTFLADQSIRVYPADESVTLDGEEVLFWYVEFGYQEVVV